MKLKKSLSILLAICMVLSSVSFAYADEIPVETFEKIEGTAQQEIAEVEAETTSTEDSVEKLAEPETVAAEGIEEKTVEDEETEKAIGEAETEETLEIKEEETKAEETKVEETETNTKETLDKAEGVILIAELDDVIVTLKAGADAFDNKGELSLKVTPVEIAETDEEALDAVEKENVAKRVTYDITVYDDGEVIEPVKEVKVSFELKDAPSGADGVNIYHHDEEDGIEILTTQVLKEDAIEETAKVGGENVKVTEVTDITEEVLDKNIEVKEVSEEELADTDDVEIEDDVTVEVKTDSFSLYTVDFTYKDKTISIAGDSTGNKLDDIVAQLGIEEKIEEATTYQDAECTEAVASGEIKNDANETLFSVYEQNDVWYVDAENAFQTEHGLVIKTADGAKYKIKVTDDYVPVATASGTTSSGIRWKIPANIEWHINDAGNLVQSWDNMETDGCVDSFVFSRATDADGNYNMWTESSKYTNFRAEDGKRYRDAAIDNGEIKKDSKKFGTAVIYYEAPNGMDSGAVAKELKKLSELWACGYEANCPETTKCLAAVDKSKISFTDGIFSFEGIDEESKYLNGYGVNFSNENNSGSGGVESAGNDGCVHVDLNLRYDGDFVSSSAQYMSVLITSLANLNNARSSEDVSMVYERKSRGGDWHVVDEDCYNGEWIYEIATDKWRYLKADKTTYASDQWALDNYKWFYLGSNSYMVTSSIIDYKGNKYCVDDKGIRISNGWYKLNDYWYFAEYDGKLVKAASGTYIKRTINAKEYAFDENARLITNKSYIVIDGVAYSADAEGVLTKISSGGGSSSGGGGGGGSVGGSTSGTSGSGITGSKPATTPITVAANGTQTMGTSVASKPIAQFTKEEQKNIYGKGGQTAWTISNGSYQLKDNAGNLVKNRWALVSDNLSSSGIGNVSNFYFDENGNMLIGWQWIKDADGLYRQYFFNNENGSLLGACLMGGTKDGKTLNEKGQVVVNGAVQAFATKPAS